MHGGKRSGAGRKSQYSGPTKVMRVPEAMVTQIRQVIHSSGADSKALPLFSASVSAGFPSPADDHMECRLDLNEHLIHHPSATFFARASGHSMINAGIHDGDLLVVDRSLEPASGKVVVAAINGELTVKRFIKEGSKAWLMPENPDYQAIEIDSEHDVHVWGVVTSVIHKV